MSRTMNRIHKGLAVMVFCLATTVSVHAQGVSANQSRWNASRAACGTSLVGRIARQVLYTTAVVAKGTVRAIGRVLMPRQCYRPIGSPYYGGGQVIVNPGYNPGYGSPVVVNPGSGYYGGVPASMMTPAAAYRPVYGFGTNVFAR